MVARLDVQAVGDVTLEAWAGMDEDEPGELVDGRLVEEEVPSVLHEAVVVWLIRAIGAWAIARGARVFGSELKLGIKALRRGRKPDVTVFLAGALPARGSVLVTKPPAVAIEVVSPRPRDVRRDRLEKLGEYARFGVPSYWLLDPSLRLLEVLELGEDGRYTIALSACEGTCAIPGCDGLTLDLDALWAEIDGLPEGDDDGGAAAPGDSEA